MPQCRRIVRRESLPAHWSVHDSAQSAGIFAVTCASQSETKIARFCRFFRHRVGESRVPEAQINSYRRLPLAVLTTSFTVKLFPDCLSCCLACRLVVMFACHHENMLTSLFFNHLSFLPTYQTAVMSTCMSTFNPAVMSTGLLCSWLTNTLHSKQKILLVKWFALQ
jgi:hypothetical protein